MTIDMVLKLIGFAETCSLYQLILILTIWIQVKHKTGSPMQEDW